MAERNKVIRDQFGSIINEKGTRNKENMKVAEKFDNTSV